MSIDKEIKVLKEKIKNALIFRDGSTGKKSEFRKVQKKITGKNDEI